MPRPSPDDDPSAATDIHTRIAFGLVRCRSAPRAYSLRPLCPDASVDDARTGGLSAARPDLNASHSRYSPPQIFTPMRKPEYAVSAADRPSAASIAQKNEPDMTPAANANAARRPEVLAIDMIARLLGPGLAVPTKYAEYAMSRLALNRAWSVMAVASPSGGMYGIVGEPCRARP